MFAHLYYVREITKIYEFRIEIVENFFVFTIL